MTQISKTKKAARNDQRQEKNYAKLGIFIKQRMVTIIIELEVNFFNMKLRKVLFTI